MSKITQDQADLLDALKHGAAVNSGVSDIANGIKKAFENGDSFDQIEHATTEIARKIHNWRIGRGV